ncbi:MAG: DNA primase, partial [Paramuribaculum sp.]|nr:DNA primase [Paramuribaculum sp.]
LSKIHTKYTKLPTELERLPELVPVAVYNLKCAHVEFEIREINRSIAEIYASSPAAMDEITNMMRHAAELNEIKKELAKYLGERILSPRVRK